MRVYVEAAVGVSVEVGGLGKCRCEQSGYVRRYEDDVWGLVDSPEDATVFEEDEAARFAEAWDEVFTPDSEAMKGATIWTFGGFSPVRADGEYEDDEDEDD